MNRPKPYRWHAMLAVLVLLYLLLPPITVEKYYSTGVYPYIHGGLYWIFSWLPFPGFYLILFALFILLLKWLGILFSKDTIGKKVTRITAGCCKWAAWYLILWGFNYGRIPLEDGLRLEIRPMSRVELMQELDTLSVELTALRLQMEQDTIPVDKAAFTYKDVANSKLAYVLHQWDYKVMPVKGWELAEDMLLRFDVGGQYMPYTGEANIDAGVHYYNKPYYMMHEMCHANGFTDEASCNFISYVACDESGEKGLIYSAKINYFRYLLGDLYAMDSTALKNYRDSLPPVLKYDLDMLRRHALAHTFKTAVIGEKINNAYLKLMGVKEGTLSYNKMVLLVYAWRHRISTSQVKI